MQSIKTAVMTALSSAATLSTLGGRIYFHYPSDFTNLPALSYFETSNLGNLYADNVEAGSEIIYQLDLWSRSSTTVLAKAVDDIMIGIDFNRILCVDMYETDTKIYHKSMRYRIDYSDPNF